MATERELACGRGEGARRPEAAGDEEKRPSYRVMAGIARNGLLLVVAAGGARMPPSPVGDVHAATALWREEGERTASD
ncbi:hypothetical protein ACP4OV_030941 [Aristida adscensionis]